MSVAPYLNAPLKLPTSQLFAIRVLTFASSKDSFILERNGFALNGFIENPIACLHWSATEIKQNKSLSFSLLYKESSVWNVPCLVSLLTSVFALDGVSLGETFLLLVQRFRLDDHLLQFKGRITVQMVLLQNKYIQFSNYLRKKLRHVQKFAYLWTFLQAQRKFHSVLAF